MRCVIIPQYTVFVLFYTNYNFNVGIMLSTYIILLTSSYITYITNLSWPRAKETRGPTSAKTLQKLNVLFVCRRNVLFCFSKLMERCQPNDVRFTVGESDPQISFFVAQVDQHMSSKQRCPFVCFNVQRFIGTRVNRYTKKISGSIPLEFCSRLSIIMYNNSVFDSRWSVYMS